MRVLLVKTSSLGDLIHSFPALTDAVAAHDNIKFDWLVESAFAEVPLWHPAVERVIPIDLRAWRKAPAKALSSGALSGFWADLRRYKYDLIIDAQSLIAKSALPALLARGPTVGYDWASARESAASLFYKKNIPISRKHHAIERIRQLFATALNYDYVSESMDYGLSLATTGNQQHLEKPYLVFIHATTWASKHWPENYWRKLLSYANKAGYDVYFPWLDKEEKARVERVVSGAKAGFLLPRMSLTELAHVLSNAAGMVGVDSGLTHIAAGLAVPGIGLYGPTKTDLTGAKGPYLQSLAADFDCSPCMQRICSYVGDNKISPACFSSLPAYYIWQQLQQRMEQKRP